MASSFDLINDNAFERKTDGTLRVTISNADGTDLTIGTHTFYMTVRKSVPSTSVSTDVGADVLFSSTVTAAVIASETTKTISFSLSQTVLNIEPRRYFYDIKWNDPTDKTVSLTKGYALLEVKADITRSNI